MQYNVVKLFKKTCCFIFEGKISLLSSMSECCYSLVSVRILKLMLSVSEIFVTLGNFKTIEFLLIV
jgi:hypothetical protein